MGTPLQNTYQSLSRKGYRVYLCATKTDALSVIFTDILTSDLCDKIIGMSHSETLEQLQLLERLLPKARNVYFHKPPDTTPEDDRNALRSDYYFLSANAVSEDGYIVNIDGTGNRVAASCFGPKQVTYVIGRNKIVKTMDDAVDRAIHYATLEVAKKYNKDVDRMPCINTGKCSSCHCPVCPGGALLISRKPLFGQKASIILVDEEMGI